MLWLKYYVFPLKRASTWCVFVIGLSILTNEQTCCTAKWLVCCSDLNRNSSNVSVANAGMLIRFPPSNYFNETALLIPLSHFVWYLRYYQYDHTCIKQPVLIFTHAQYFHRLNCKTFWRISFSRPWNGLLITRSPEDTTPRVLSGLVLCDLTSPLTGLSLEITMGACVVINSCLIHTMAWQPVSLSVDVFAHL